MSNHFPAPSTLPSISPGATQQGAYQTLPPVLSPEPGFAFVPDSNETKPAVADGGFVHFLRFLLVWFLMGLSCLFVVGIVWVMIALSNTGRRKRDILMFYIPVWGAIVQIQTLWRYSAKNVYWSVRTDRGSKSLFAS